MLHLKKTGGRPYCDFWAEKKTVRPSEIKRMIDAEYISELFIAMMHGIQQKDRDSLDGFYRIYGESFPNKRSNNP